MFIGENMRYRTAEFLKCPYDNHFPLGIYPFEEVSVEYEPGDGGIVSCRSFCHYRKKRKIEPEECLACLGREIREGILFCHECGRYYPVKEGIPVLLPDGMRRDSLEEVLKGGSLPERVLGSIRNPDPAGEKGAGVDDKISEMEKRDEESGIYDALYPREACLSEIELYLNMLRPRSGDLILDTGCGTGRITREFLPFSGEVVGVDFSFESLRYFENRMDRGQKMKTHLVQADIAALPLRSLLFDKAISTSALCFLPSKSSREEGLRLIRETLKQEGVLVVSVYNYSFLKILSGLLGSHGAGKKEGYHSGGKIRYYNYGRGELVEWLSSGFRVERVRGSDHRVPLLSGLHPKLAVFLDRMLGKTFMSIPLFAREMTALCVKTG